MVIETPHGETQLKETNDTKTRDMFKLNIRKISYNKRITLSELYLFLFLPLHICTSLVFQACTAENVSLS